MADADDLVALGAQLQAAIESVEAQLGTVFDALGLSGLPVPELDLLKVTSSKGKNAERLLLRDRHDARPAPRDPVRGGRHPGQRFRWTC